LRQSPALGRPFFVVVPVRPRAAIMLTHRAIGGIGLA
jgi:hypothetical protein